METLLATHFSWLDLLVVALLLYGIYALLVLINNRLERSKRVEGFRASTHRFLTYFILLYEPLTILVLALIFLFINPAVHGVILLVVIVAGFSRLRDYLSGRIILFMPLVKEGQRMRTPKSTGVISRIGRIGLYLQTGEGLHFVNYSSLLTEGYSLVTGKDIGGFYRLNVTPPEGATNPLQQLSDKFLTTPYLDRSLKPDLSYEGDEGSRIRARISVREEKHLSELLALLAEWGYPATIARK